VGKASRDKGARGEVEVGHIFRDSGFPEADRGARLGKHGDDVIRVAGCHVEVKRTEKLRLWESLEQANRDAPEGMMPVLAFRRNRSEWHATVKLADLIALLKA
jgi:hypothetical protein